MASANTLDVVIPFSPFERILLGKIQNTYLEETRTIQRLLIGPPIDSERFGVDPAHATAFDWPRTTIDPEGRAPAGEAKLFLGWSWAAGVADALSSSQSEEFLNGLHGIKGYDGDRRRSFTDAMDTLKCRGRTKLFRVELLEAHNAGIRDRLACDATPRLHFVPHDSDASFWDTVMRMYLVGHRTQLLNVGSERGRKSRIQIRSEDDRHATYDIWSLALQFSLSCRRPGNATNVESCLFNSAVFKEKFALRPKEDNTLRSLSLTTGGPRVEIIDSRAVTSAAELSDLEHAAESPEDHRVLERLRRAHKASLNYPLHDPRSYVEFIPWVELQPTSSTELESVDIPVFLPYRTDTTQASLAVRWMLWKPASNEIFDCHHLYTEDEVYQYCIENNWHFPGHFLHNRVIFAASPLEATQFVSGLRRFWQHWNDCALTVDPSNHQVYLLETIPGRQYRCRQELRGDETARLYFRSVVEDHAQRHDSKQLIDALFGKDFSPNHRHVLRYLHLDRFADFDSEPLGSGGSGTVYGATWTLPPVSLRSMQPNGATLSVVLKQILPKFSEVEHMKKFLRELDITVTALEGSPVNCVEFLGITRASVDRAGRIAASSKTFDGEQRLFLVFQRATEGNLLTFMERRLDNLPATENSWFVVANVLGAIASGLALIHERGIVHGDLHPGNVLVTKKFYPRESGDDAEGCEFLLADFGEGSHFEERSVASAGGSFVCPIGAYVAPEVKHGNGKSPEADTYSFGRICRMIVSIQRAISSKKGCRNWEATPISLRAILDRCDARNDADRPNMTQVRRDLDSLCFDILDEKAEFSVAVDKEFEGDIALLTLGGELTRAQAELYANLQALA